MNGHAAAWHLKSQATNAHVQGMRAMLGPPSRMVCYYGAVVECILVMPRWLQMSAHARRQHFQTNGTPPAEAFVPAPLPTRDR